MSHSALYHCDKTLTAQHEEERGLFWLTVSVPGWLAPRRKKAAHFLAIWKQSEEVQKQS